MTTNQAIQIVVRAAEAQSNGHRNCMEILRACEMVRELNRKLALTQMRHGAKPMTDPLSQAALPPGTADRDCDERNDDYQRQCEEDVGEERMERDKER